MSVSQEFGDFTHDNEEEHAYQKNRLLEKHFEILSMHFWWQKNYTNQEKIICFKYSSHYWIDEWVN